MCFLKPTKKMVLKNQKIGNVEGITLIELGNGDTKVGFVKQDIEKYVGIAFTNDEPKPIGTKHNTAGTTTDDARPNAIITFTTVESIEVLQRQLNNAKIVLRNMPKT